jgi:hypothetical protein
MKPEKFEGHNIVLGEGQEQYQDLPAQYNPDDKNGEMVTCWKLTIRERIRLMITGRLWLSCYTFREPFQPVRLSTKKINVPDINLKIVKP